MIGPTNARGGGGLNLKVVGGTTKPANPRENTIWVNTTTAITGYALSPTQPETGTEGLVWLKTADTGVEINVGRKNAVLLHLMQAKLYVNGKWANVEGYVYTGGQWKQFSAKRLYLIENGKKLVDFTQIGSGSITEKETGYVTVETSSNNATVVYAKKNVNSFTTFALELITPTSEEKLNQSYYTTGTPCVAISAAVPVISGDKILNFDVLTYLNNRTGIIDVKTYNADITGLSDEKYLSVTVGGSQNLSGRHGALHIKNLYLE